MSTSEIARISRAPRIIESRSPGLFQIASQVRKKGALQFFLDQRSVQGDLPQLRMGLHRLFLIIHPEHVRHVLHTDRQNFDKLKTWESSRQLMLGDGLIASNGPAWKRQRRLMSTSFTPRSVEQYHSLMAAAAEAATKRWDSIAKAGQPVDLFDEMARVTAWIILRSMFGTDISEERLRSMEGHVENLIEFVNHREMLPVKPPLWAPLPRHRRYREAKTQVDSLIHDIIARRRAETQSRWPNDLLSKLMSVRDEETGEAMSDQLVRDECLGIFVAGHETTARTLSFLWYALHENPDVAKRLRAELDSVLPQGQPPALEHFQKLPYMDRVLKEVLRLYPPAPAFPRDPIADLTLNDVHIPAGTFLLVFPYATHRHPDFWDEPERFDPDRFLPEKEAALHPYAYYPFGAGSRLCLGNGFAMLEMRILTTMLVPLFEARLVEGHRPRIDIGGTLMVRNGLPMRIARRS
jgi:cytochrome P450